MKGILNLDLSDEVLKGAKHDLQTILKERSIFYGNFVLASGQKSDYYLDTRLTTLSPDGVFLSAYLIWAMIQPVLDEVSGVAGPSIGADPIISGVCQLSYLLGKPLKAGLVRKENKAHGRGRLVEGPIQRGETIIAIEDVITTGTSSLQAVNALREHGCKVDHLICLVLREKRGQELLEGEGALKVHPLFDVAELL